MISRCSAANHATADFGRASSCQSGSVRTHHLAGRLDGLGTTVFAEMSALAVETGAVNLGQGFPDTDGPGEIADAAIAAIRAGVNQYPPGPGIADLRSAICDHQRRFYGIDLDPATAAPLCCGLPLRAISSAIPMRLNSCGR